MLDNSLCKKTIIWPETQNTSSNEIDEFLTSLDKKKLSTDFDFYASIFRTDIGKSLFQDCYNMMNLIKYDCYTFKPTTIGNSSHMGVFHFQIGENDVTLDESTLSYGGEASIKNAFDRILKLFIDTRISDVIQNKDVKPIIKEYANKVRNRGDVDNGFIDYALHIRFPNERVLELCSNTLSDWLTDQFIKYPKLLKKIQKIIYKARDAMRTKQFIKDRNEFHKGDMIKRVAAILKENTSVMQQVTEAAINEATIDMVMEA